MVIAENSATSYVGSLPGVVKIIEGYGLNAQEIFASVGVDLQSTQAFDERIPMDAIVDAIARAAEKEIDPLFGLKFAETVHPTTYHAFSVMLVSSNTLRAFCQRLQRYYLYINNGDRLYFEECGDQYCLRLVPPALVEQSHQEVIQISAWAATWLKYMRMAYRPDFAPEKVTFTFSSPTGYENHFFDYFACAVEFSADSNALWLKQSDLDLPLPGGNAELARRSEQKVFEYLQSIGYDDLLNSVRMKLFELLPKGHCHQAQVAKGLGMDDEALAGRLKATGKNYQQILSDTRRELSEEYIMRSELSVNEIAYLLGFSDCSNFARSFRRWTGLSPTEFREQAHVGIT